MIQDVLQSYRTALQRGLPLISAHLFVRLVITSLMVPLISLALATTLLFTDQTGLTDQDIAKFFFTPAGFLGAIAILSLLIVALVLDVVVATVILRQNPRGFRNALRVAANAVLSEAPGLFAFVARFLVRVLLIVAPFALLGGLVWALFLTAHDINYYLSETPPEFWTAVALFAAILSVLAVILLVKLSSWAIALHMTIFDHQPAQKAFRQSHQKMRGDRLKLTGRLLGWLALRLIAASCLGALAAAFVTWFAGQQIDNLRNVSLTLLIAGACWTAGNAVLNAVSNGALADLLNAQFERHRDEALKQKRKPTSQVDGRKRVLLAAVALVSLAGLGAGGVLTEQLKQDANVDIIGHRGAGAHAPENTMVSVLRAIEDGADWVEIDVQENADGEVIVIHDSDFMKVAGVSTKVWDATNEDLADIDIGSWFSKEFSDQRTPLLQDVLLAARDTANVIIELKYYGHDQDLERKTIEIVEATGMQDQIATMSLKYDAVQKMRSLRPTWRTGVLAATSLGDVGGLEGDFIALNQASLTAGVIHRAQTAGKDVYAWTVNDPMSVVRMLWAGVDGLITDDPARMRQVIEEYNALTLAERVILSLSDRFNVTLDPVDGSGLRR